MKISKFVARFFERMENHILDGSYPDTVPAFTPIDANPNHKSAMSAATAYVGERIPTERASAAEKAKADVSPPGTPASPKRAFFHCKEGTPVHELFPADLIKKYCSFFCFHNKKCSKPHQSCDFEHIGRWDRVPPEDQIKILEHCHASKEKIKPGKNPRVIFDASTKSHPHEIVLNDMTTTEFEATITFGAAKLKLL